MALPKSRNQGIALQFRELLAHPLVQRLPRDGDRQFPPQRPNVILRNADRLLELGHGLLFFGKLRLRFLDAFRIRDDLLLIRVFLLVDVFRPVDSLFLVGHPTAPCLGGQTRGRPTPGHPDHLPAGTLPDPPARDNGPDAAEQTAAGCGQRFGFGPRCSPFASPLRTSGDRRNGRYDTGRRP